MQRLPERLEGLPVIPIDQISHLPMLFRKRPVVVKARRFTRHDDVDLAHWCKGELINTVDPETGAVTHAQIDITTPEGVMAALIGDWIIRGVAGEHYPCKHHIFEATYEPLVAR